MNSRTFILEIIIMKQLKLLLAFFALIMTVLIAGCGTDSSSGAGGSGAGGTDYRLSTFTSSNGAVTRYVYNDVGQLMHRISSGTTETNTYDSRGRLLYVTHSNGDMESYIYNDAGQLTEQQGSYNDGDRSSYLYTYNNNSGQLEQLVEIFFTTFSDGAASVSTTTYTYNYNSAGQLVQTITTPDFGSPRTTTYTYNGNGQLIQLTLSTGYSSTYTYNDTGQLIQRHDTSSDGSSTGTATYDYEAEPASFFYIPGTIDHLLFEDALRQGPNAVSGGTSSPPRGYRLSRSLGFSSDGNTESIYRYNDTGQLMSRTVIDGIHDDQIITTYSYNERNQRIAVSLQAFTGGNIPYNITYTYDDDGQLVQEQIVYDGNDSDSTGTTTYTYNSNAQLIQETTRFSTSTVYFSVPNSEGTGASGTIAYLPSTTITYTYNDTGMLIQQVQEREYNDEIVEIESSTRTYTYNNSGQLEQEIFSEFSNLDGDVFVGTSTTTFNYSSAGQFVQTIGYDEVDNFMAIDIYEPEPCTFFYIPGTIRHLLFEEAFCQQ